MSNICGKNAQTFLRVLTEYICMDVDVVENNINRRIRWICTFPFPGKGAGFCPLMSPGGRILQD